MDTMPGVPIAVSLSDILEVRGGPLREREVWALLCQSAAAIQDFFIKGASSKKDDTFFVISPVTLTVCRDGQVNLTPGESTWHGNDFKAPECCSDTAHMLSDTATEKFVATNSLKLICRAHQLVHEGYKYMFDEKLVTVWSAPNYCYRCGNIAAVLSFTDAEHHEAKLFKAVPDSERVIPPRTQTPYFL